MKKILLILFIITYSILDAQIVQIKKLVPSDPVADGRFGSAVDIDGEIAITGAYWDDNNGFTATGAVYIHYRNQGGIDQWGVIKKLIPSDPEDNKQFGFYVDLESNILVVGAPNDNNDQGAAYVFYKDEGGTDNWGQVVKLTHTQHSYSNGDEFGISVSIENNMIAVGSHRYTTATVSETGAVYIFEKDNGGTDNWGQVKQIISGDPDGDELFGYSVDIEGDIMVVGAYHDENNASFGGAAYVFDRNSGGTDNWGQIKKIVETPVNTHDKFGYDVDIDRTTLAISSWWHTHSGQSRAGAVYVYDQNEGGSNNWGKQKKIILAFPNSSDWFGSSLALEGDKLLIGAERADLGSTSNGGGMYLFERNEGGTNNWGITQEIKSDDMANNDRFGRQVAMSGDYMISGSYFADHSSMSNPGASYIFGPAVALNNQSIKLSGNRLNSAEVLLQWESSLTEDMYDVEVLYSKNAAIFENIKNQDLYGFHNTQEKIRQESSGYYKIKATNLNNGTLMTSNLIFIDNTNINQIVFFPNPFQDFIQLQTNTQENLELWIYNSVGKLMINYKGNTEQINTLLEKNSRNWSEGMYLFTVLSQGQSYTDKVIKR